MIGYFFLIIILLLFVFFLVKGITNWRKTLRTLPSQRGLIVSKYLTEAGTCMIVFQLRQEELHLEISPNLYPKIQPPIRGEIFLREKQVIDFLPLQE